MHAIPLLTLVGVPLMILEVRVLLRIHVIRIRFLLIQMIQLRLLVFWVVVRLLGCKEFKFVSVFGKAVQRLTG